MMNVHYTPLEAGRVARARASYSGRMLTNAQFDEAIAITGILEREIQKTGKFKDKLSDYAHAMARGAQFDTLKAETMIRDLYKARTGQTLNQHREALMEREAKLSDEDKAGARPKAYEVGSMMEENGNMPFYRAYDQQATALARELGITDIAARTLMQDAFRAAENRELYEWGKELEKKYRHPQEEGEIEKEQRETERDQSPNPGETSGRTRMRRRSRE